MVLNYLNSFVANNLLSYQSGKTNNLVFSATTMLHAQYEYII